MRLSFADLPKHRGAVLVDGAFDPLHAGHVAYLQEAVAIFPQLPLIVTIASDDQIRQKGRDPLFPADTRAAVVAALSGVDHVHVKDRSTEDVITQLRPAAYVKGKDWENRLPDAQLAACALVGAQIVYLDTVTESSSRALQQWALANADRSLDRLEAFMAAQVAPTVPWQPVTDYSFETRKAIEGEHPRLIKEVFQPSTVLDAGCGPGHLVRLLREIGVEANGFDLYPPDNPYCIRLDLCDDHSDVSQFDLVVNRECLEHLTIVEIRKAVATLCNFSSRFVYGTTRFNPSPRDIFDFTTEFYADPTHITCGTHGFLRLLFVLEGFRWRGDLARRMDWLGKGRTFCFERVNA